MKSSSETNSLQENPPTTLGDSLDFEEKPMAELGIRRCRSFRADLTHKLNILCRVAGTWDKVADLLETNANVLRSWRGWKTAPGSRDMLQKIDNNYEISLEKLRVRAAEREQRKLARQTHD